MTLLLMKEHWKRSYKATLGWTLIFFIFALVNFLVFPEIQKQSEQMEALFGELDFLKAIIGDVSITTLNGFVAGKWFATLPFLLSFYMAMASLQIVAREMDTNTIEYTLSLPISRTNLLLSRFAIVVLQSGMMMLLLHGAILLGQQMIGEWGSNDLYFYMTINSWMLMLTFSSISLFFSLFFRDYTKAMTTSTGIILGLYMLQVMFKLTSLPEWSLQWNPFYYFDPNRILMERAFPMSEVAILGTISIVLVLASLFVFQRKEIS